MNLADSVSLLNNSSINDNTSSNEGLVRIECAMFKGETVKCDALVIVKRVIGTLSVLGSLFTMFLIVVYRKYKEETQRLILNLSIAASLSALSFLLDDINEEATPQCKAQGFLVMYLIWVCCLLIMTILFNVYLSYVFGKDIKRYEIQLTIVCWVLPLLLSVLPFIGDLYGPAGSWCWIRNDWRWRFGVWYIWRILSIVVFIAVMIHITVHMFRAGGSNRHSSTMTRQGELKDFRTLRLYPVVYVLVNLFPVINRMENAIRHGDNQVEFIFSLTLLQNICDPLFGAAVAVVYVLDPNTRKKLTRKQLMNAINSWRHTQSEIREYAPEPQRRPETM